MKSFSHPFAVILVTFSLVSCGGGGGSSSDSSFSALPRLDFSSINTNEAAAEGANSMSSTSIASARNSTNIDTTNNRIVSVITSSKNLLLLRQKIETSTIACSTSGNALITLDDVTYALSIAYNNCVQNGITTNGTLSGTVSENRSSFNLSYDSFSIVANDFSLSMNGTTNITESSFTNFDREKIDGSNFTISMTFNGRTVSLSNYQMEYDTYNFTTYDVSRFSYDLSSSTLGGSMFVQSTEDIYQHYYSSNPYQGKVLLSGANNGTILITAIDSSSIQLQVDADGDSAYEVNETTTWAALSNYL